MKVVLNTGLSVLLSISVLLLGISPETFHQHEHEEHRHACHEDHRGEVDACHLAIHHGDTKACEDHDHLVEDRDRCQVCDLLAQSHWLFNSRLVEQPNAFSFQQNLKFPCLEQPIVAEVAIHDSRGPPADRITL